MSSPSLLMASPDHRRRGEEDEDTDPMESLRLSADLLPSDAFLKAAVYLKDQVVEATWRSAGGGGGGGRGRCVDPTVYTGLMGTALTCLRSYEATGSTEDLLLCAEIADTCATAAMKCPKSCRHVTFLCGRAGVYALGAVAANYQGDRRRRDFFLDHFLEVAEEKALPVGPEEGGFGMPYELLHGRAGFLWAALFVNKHLGPNTVPDSLLAPIVEAVLAGGRAGASHNMDCPLMFRWHGTRYWGAAHGLAGIMQVLLHFPLSDDDLHDIKETLRYMVRNRFPRSGNYTSSEGNPRDRLVQWSHGAGGIAVTLCKAAEVFSGDAEFRDAAVDAGEVVWRRGLLRKVGLCDGVAGNAYAFLSLYRATGEEVFLARARAFATFLHYNAEKLVRHGQPRGEDHADSLFEGLAGTACLWFDMASPANARFPGYEI